ncbi:MAG TPA: SRPBCC domain-containing protein [Solirubrobacterales bacterium]|nr:SRPBCC domain-containing protein [Solirubrobacterales bacterium]
MSKLTHTVTRSVVLDAAPAEVWEAITDEDLLSEWLAPEVELDPREGGEMVCRFEDGEERRGEIELVVEAERLAFSWWREGGGPSRVEFLVDAVAEGTRLTVIETGLVPSATPLLAAGWTPALRALRLQLGRLVLA